MSHSPQELLRKARDYVGMRGETLLSRQEEFAIWSLLDELARDPGLPDDRKREEIAKNRWPHNSGDLWAWTWAREWTLRLSSGRVVATVWPNGTWHTWGPDGTGGENSREETPEMAAVEAFKAVKRQGWDILTPEEEEFQ